MAENIGSVEELETPRTSGRAFRWPGTTTHGGSARRQCSSARRRSTFSAGTWSERSSRNLDGSPADPRPAEKMASSAAVSRSKHLTVCQSHMNARVHGLADDRLRSFQPDSQSHTTISRLARVQRRERFSVHREFALQSVRYL